MLIDSVKSITSWNHLDDCLEIYTRSEAGKLFLCETHRFANMKLIESAIRNGSTIRTNGHTYSRNNPHN